MTAEQLRAKGFIMRADGSWAKADSRIAEQRSNPNHLVKDPTPNDSKNEKQLQEWIANYLRQHNIWFARSGMHRKTSTPVGTPDFMFAINGHPIAFECKSANGTQTAEQEKVMIDMKRNGWNHFIVRDFLEAITLIRKYEEQ